MRERIMNTVTMKIMNEKNANTNDRPYIKYNDMVVTFVFDIGIENGRAIVTNDVMEQFNIGLDELILAAKANTKIKCIHLEDAIPFPIPYSGAMIVTNEEMIYGASVIMNPDYFKQFGHDVYILPSSVHEVIVMNVDDVDDVDLLKEMVRDINHGGVVSDIDFLSDDVFRYYRNLNMIIKED